MQTTASSQTPVQTPAPVDSIDVNAYLAYLDSIVERCGPVPCLTPVSNAVTRRAKKAFFAERDALKSWMLRTGKASFPKDTVFEQWPRLRKSRKYDVLVENYADPGRGAMDTCYPQDGRLVPLYAKQALAQLRTLTACAMAA